MSTYKTIKKIYKKEKKKNDKKNMTNMYYQYNKIRKQKKQLYSFNMELMEIISDQHDRLDADLKKHDQNMKTIQTLKIEIKNKEVALTKMIATKETPQFDSKVIIGTMLTWLMILFLYKNEVVDNESFMVMNLCAFLSSIVVSMF
tara:strand:- start:188 stop:622 length:435 start_codon:yes stop_codon:yes gene_type:complete